LVFLIAYEDAYEAEVHLQATPYRE